MLPKTCLNRSCSFLLFFIFNAQFFSTCSPPFFFFFSRFLFRWRSIAKDSIMRALFPCSASQILLSCRFGVVWFTLVFVACIDSVKLFENNA